MTTESEGVHLGSNAFDGSNASRVEVGSGQMSETLVDPLSSQDQELEAKGDGDGQQERCVTVESEIGSLASADDLGIEKLNGFTDLAKEKESLNEGLDLGKDSDGIQTELLVEKEVEPDMVTSHGDVKGSDVRLDREDLVDNSKPDGSGKKAENFDIECFMDLEPHESKDESTLDHDSAPMKLSDSDLVWAKVRSHPWWPGQIFDTSAATDKAKKYCKKGSFLVTYFGDCTFAWNDASRIKPFHQHFSQMAKKSTLPDFLDAIDFALEEVSRRIEFGLSCPCISEEVYQKIKTQNIINPGIREDSSRIHGGDKVSSAIFFEATILVDYVKRLASSPSYDDTDELQFVCQRAKLLAFNRWKGFTDLPEFETLEGSVESAPKISPAVKESATKPRKTKRRKIEGQDDCKQDGVFEYEDTKEKTLAEFVAEKRLSKSNGNRSHEHSGMKPDCEKKRKVVHSKLPKSAKKIKANLQTEGSGSPISPKNDRRNYLSAGDKITPKKTRTSFGIGASILRVANQMHCSTLTGVKPCSNSTLAAKNNGRGPSHNGTLSSHHSASATKTQNGKPIPISIDNLHSRELEHVVEETPSTNLVEDSMLESRDLKASVEEQIVNEDRKEAANIVCEMTIADSNLTEEKITDSRLETAACLQELF